MNSNPLFNTMDEKTKAKINEISQKYCNTGNETPFGLRMFMGMGEFAQYLSQNPPQNNDEGGTTNV